MKKAETDYDEYAGGTIDIRCPLCGQFCKNPGYYTPTFWALIFTGCEAKSYCKRCRKNVLLSVEYI